MKTWWGFSFVVAVVGLAAGAAGCVAGEIDGPGEVLEESEAPVIVKNNFDPATFLAFRTDIAQMGLEPLKETTIVKRLMTTAAGQSVLKYNVRCALGPTQAVSFWDPNQGRHVTFKGTVGIATGWTGAALTPTQSTWRWSCLAALLNPWGLEVELEMLAPSSLVPINGPKVREAAFAATTSGGEIIACWDKAYSICCPKMELASFRSRICGQATSNCGIKVVGPCSDLGNNGVKACEGSGQNRAFYGMHDKPSVNGVFPANSSVTNNVLTTFINSCADIKCTKAL